MLFHAPVEAADHVRAKATLFSLLLLPLSLGLGCGVCLVFTPSPALAALSLANFLVLPLSLACMNTGLGLAWVGAGAGHAEEVLASPAGVLAMVLGLLLVIFQNALMVLPQHTLWERALWPQRGFIGPWLVLDLLLWVGLHAYAASVPLTMAVRKIEGRE
jgi:hypothetical protein